MFERNTNHNSNLAAVLPNSRWHRLLDQKSKYTHNLPFSNNTNHAFQSNVIYNIIFGHLIRFFYLHLLAIYNLRGLSLIHI